MSRIKCKKTLFSVALLFVLSVTLLSYSINIQKSISSKVIRLHILANSNSSSDQTLKIKVRDRILKESSALFENVSDKAECRVLMEKEMPHIISAAEDEIRKNGFSYSVDASFGIHRFPMKVYDNFALPSGEYEALRIEIGKAEGENWWCVMFPPLCFVDGSVENPLKGTLSAEELALTSTKGGVNLRFKTVDFLSSSVTSFKTAFKK